ncbi:MAG: hypothetical protein WAT81_02930 [Candidatus Moraniibacteriota bacterium]
MQTLFTSMRLLGVLILTFGLGIGAAFLPSSLGSLSGTISVFAKEYEDEEDEDEYRPRSVSVPAPAVVETSVPSPVKTEKVAKPKTVIQEVVETIPVTETYVETDPGYDIDSDGDGLVDAIDPDPVVSQTTYFTDDDGDSVPNAIDTHPGSDDLLMLDELTDANANGILDSYESL